MAVQRVGVNLGSKPLQIDRDSATGSPRARRAARPRPGPRLAGHPTGLDELARGARRRGATRAWLRRRRLPAPRGSAHGLSPGHL